MRICAYELNLSSPSLLSFQHPGFDFSGAQFSGEAPNPRTFLGGMDAGKS